MGIRKAFSLVLANELLQLALSMTFFSGANLKFPEDGIHIEDVFLPKPPSDSVFTGTKADALSMFHLLNDQYITGHIKEISNSNYIRYCEMMKKPVICGTIAHIAARHNLPGIMTAYISSKEALTFDEIGYTPTHYAAYRGSLDVLSMLLKINDVNLNAPSASTKLTPLHLAVYSNKIETVNFLLNASKVAGKDTPNEIPPTALINILNKDYNGDTVFHVAAKIGNVEIMRALFAYNDDKRIFNDTNNAGENLLDIAILSHNQDLQEFLIAIEKEPQKDLQEDETFKELYKYISYPIARSNDIVSTLHRIVLRTDIAALKDFSKYARAEAFVEQYQNLNPVHFAILLCKKKRMNTLMIEYFNHITSVEEKDPSLNLLDALKKPVYSYINMMNGMISLHKSSKNAKWEERCNNLKSTLEEKELISSEKAGNASDNDGLNLLLVSLNTKVMSLEQTGGGNAGCSTQADAVFRKNAKPELFSKCNKRKLLYMKQGVEENNKENLSSCLVGEEKLSTECYFCNQQFFICSIEMCNEHCGEDDGKEEGTKKSDTCKQCLINNCNASFRYCHGLVTDPFGMSSNNLAYNEESKMHYQPILEATHKRKAEESI